MVDLDALEPEAVDEIARSSTYTWNFPNTPPNDGGDDHAAGSNGGEGAAATAVGGDRPPDPGG
jgi:hypothetical protein